MNKKRMIVMDLDGTLLNEKSKVSKKTKIYLSELKQEGYKIVIATGRILGSAIIATDGAEFANYIVTDAGAAIYKNTNKNDVWKNIYIAPISRKIAEDIIEKFNNEEFAYIDLCSKNYVNMYATKYISKNVVVKKYTDKNEILENINEIIHIAVGFWKNEFVKKYQQIFIERYPSLDIKIMQDSFGDIQWLELSNKGIEKYSGIYKIAQIEKVENKDIIAFGDGLNDVDMIKKCGIGVAMKNALADVKTRADFVTDKSNLEDGIVDFLEKYL